MLMTYREPVLNIPVSNMVHRSGSLSSDQQGVTLSGSCHARLSPPCSSPSHSAMGLSSAISPTADDNPHGHAVPFYLTAGKISIITLSGTADKTLSVCDVAGQTDAPCVLKSSYHNQPARRSILSTILSHKFCKKTECPHYGAVIAPFARKCYYGPQCWRGDLDEMNAMLASILHLSLSKGRVQR